MTIFISEAIGKGDAENRVVNKKASYIKYNGEKRDRLIEPVALGTTKRGNWAIRAFQISGPTNTKNMEWKIFLLDKIDSVSDANLKMKKRPKFNKGGDKTFNDVVAIANFDNRVVSFFKNISKYLQPKRK
jgi:hypothetical protein